MAGIYFDGKVPSAKKSQGGIFVDQVGYYPDSAKTAVLTFEAEFFAIIDGNGEKLFEGKTAAFGHDECSGDDIWLADFSGFKRNGSYRVTAGGRTSAVFHIGEKIYSNVLQSTAKAYYFLRCGCSLDKRFAGKYTHAACHTDKARVLGENRYSDVTGGWHDAGDYGKYVTAGACACAQLLYAYKLFPAVFEKLGLELPESNDTKLAFMPDILHECRYELEWLMKMQREDGGVYHKTTTMQHAPFVMPEDDTAELFVFPVSSGATADLCAVCALASGVYSAFDKDFSDKLRRAAELSYNWLEEHPQFVGFRNPDGCGTGEYSEDSDRDNRLWAAAEMFALTGSADCNLRFKELLENITEDIQYYKTALGYGIIGGLGSLAYIFSEQTGKDHALSDSLKNLFVGEAYWFADKAGKSGYGASMTKEDYYWGSNMALLQHGMKFALAEMFTGNNMFRSLAEQQLHVLLGTNPFGISYVTGCGEYHCNSPHLRPSFADGIDECIPGFVCGGPNRFLNDSRAKEIIPPDTPPMKCFADDPMCYSLNEVTIYWNSPAVFLLAYLENT